MLLAFLEQFLHGFYICVSRMPHSWYFGHGSAVGLCFLKCGIKINLFTLFSSKLLKPCETSLSIAPPREVCKADFNNCIIIVSCLMIESICSFVLVVCKDFLGKCLILNLFLLGRVKRENFFPALPLSHSQIFFQVHKQNLKTSFFLVPLYGPSSPPSPLLPPLLPPNPPEIPMHAFSVLTLNPPEVKLINIL